MFDIITCAITIVGERVYVAVAVAASAFKKRLLACPQSQSLIMKSDRAGGSGSHALQLADEAKMGQLRVSKAGLFNAQSHGWQI